MPRRAASVVLWVFVALWGAGILWLSSLGPKELPEAAFLAPDKINHFIAFAAGGWLVASALRMSRPRLSGGACTLLAVLLTAAFGAFDEALQTFTPGRTGGDPYDWIADFLGAMAGALLTFTTHACLERFVARP
jgi:VanZ family protein